MIMEQKSRAEFLTRFRREADAIAALDHVNIVPIYEYGEQEDIAYLVMPYIPGGTLRDVIEKRHSLPLEEVVPIIEQAAAALDSAHGQNIIHRDLKPGNMLFHADGRLLLADFGLAKVLRDTSDETGRKQTELTSVGTIVGTPEYLSPEQGTGKELDYRTDVYSLGVVLYQMLTGRVPFTGATPVAIALKHALEAPPSLRSINPDIPPLVEEIVLKTLAKAPEQRYASAGELARALRDAAKDVKVREKVQEIQTVITKPPMPIDEQEEDGEPSDSLSEEEPENKALEAEIETDPVQSDPAHTDPIQSEDEEDTLKEKLDSPIENYETQINEHGPHADETEATPRIGLVPQIPQALAYTPDTDHFYERGERGKKLQLPEPAVAAQPMIGEAKRPEKRRGLQHVGMMLLGSFLTLIIVVGGLGVYVEFLAKKTQPSPAIHASGTATPKAQASVTPESPSALPPAMMPRPGTPINNGAGINVPALGPLLYGTTTPGSTCDKQGGQWSNTQNAQISCNQGLILHNNDQNVLAGTFLGELPQGKTIPDNYVLQVDVTVHSDSSGQFGVFFRNQPGQQHQGTDSILLTPPNTWNMDEYQDITGAPTNLANIQTQIQLTGTFTVDVLVANDTYVLFINGNEQGYAKSSTYMTGNVGLAAGAGADVTFKNFEVYPLT
jgi:serine/threonine protein kinase